MSNLGQLVKWQDGVGEQGGGWHTGKLILKPSRTEYVRYFVDSPGRGNGHDLTEMLLVQESCCGTLTWVESSRLSEYLSRKERGEE